MIKYRILYMCSYIPHQYLESLGFECINIYSLSSRDLLQTKKLKCICSLAEYGSMVNFDNFDGVIFGNCCNSVQRLYDYVNVHYPKLFRFLLLIPKNTQELSYRFLLGQYITLVTKLCRHFHMSDNLLKAPLFQLEEETPVSENTVWIVGSCISQNYLIKLREILHMLPMWTTVCSSHQRGDRLLLSQSRDTLSADIPCPAKVSYYDWFEQKLLTYKEKLSGVIFISMQKCDHGMFAYTEIKKLCDMNDIPILYMIEEMSSLVSERSKIRYEAFVESIILKNNYHGTEKIDKSEAME